MTESEAKTKWCPMVRFMQATDGTWRGNRDGPIEKITSHCIGSGLAEGYCGLSGKP